MDTQGGYAPVPTAQVIDDELFVDGKKIILKASDIIKMNLINENGSVNLELSVRRHIGRVSELAEKKRES